MKPIEFIDEHHPHYESYRVVRDGVILAHGVTRQFKVELEAAIGESKESHAEEDGKIKEPISETIPNEKKYSESEVLALKLIPGLTNRITLYRKRNAHLIGFYVIGNKIFYDESHIRDFLARCEQKVEGQQQ